jgi:hypothetical protein
VRKAVLESKPEAIVHEATALANAKWGRNFDKAFATTNELRAKGTDALIRAKVRIPDSSITSMSRWH